jgi:hypothetical protein
MKAMILLPALLFAGVGTAEAQQEERVHADNGGTVTFHRDKGVTTGRIPGPPDSVYRRLRSVSTDLGLTIKPSGENPAGHEFLIDRQRLVTRLGKKPVSTYLSCGEGMTGPNADSWFVYLTVRAVVSPAAGTDSELQLQLSADAVDVPGGRSDRVVCATNGSLEAEIMKRLQTAPPK